MNNTLTPIEYASQRILTTQQLAESYGTETRRISENFNQNKDRYIEGKHYYNLEGEDLKAFRDLYGNSVVVDRTPKLYLWTEKGALLHAKSLNTDTAWAVYDELVENYFDKLPKTNKAYLPTKDKILRQNINIADMLIKIGVKPGIAYATAKRASEAATAAEKKKLDEEKAILNERIKNIDAEIKKIRELSSARSEQEAMDKLKKQLAVAEAEYKNARLDEHGDDFDIENKRLEVERLRQELTKAEQNAAENAIVKALEEEKAVLQEQIRTIEDSASSIKDDLNAAASGMTEDIRQIALEWAESQVPPVTEEEIKNAVVAALEESGIFAGDSESGGESPGSGVSFGAEYSSKLPGVSVAGATMLERVARSLGHTLDSYMASEGAKADARRAAEAGTVNHYDIKNEISVDASDRSTQEVREIFRDEMRREGLK